MAQFEANRKERERRMMKKMKLIENKNQQKERNLNSLRCQLRAKDEERFQTVRNNSLVSHLSKLKKNGAYSTYNTNFNQTSSNSSPKIGTETKVKAVQEKAQKQLEESKRLLNKKMAEFDERMKRRQEYEKMTAEERKELSREWAETLTMNLEKKRRKEEYKRQMMEEKLKKLQERQEERERMQKILEKERLYTRIANEMKDYKVQEALLDMAIKKRWDIDVINSIIEAYEPNITDRVDEKVLDESINRVLNNPFTTIKVIVFILL